MEESKEKMGKNKLGNIQALRNDSTIIKDEK